MADLTHVPEAGAHATSPRYFAAPYPTSSPRHFGSVRTRAGTPSVQIQDGGRSAQQCWKKAPAVGRRRGHERANARRPDPPVFAASSAPRRQRRARMSTGRCRRYRCALRLAAIRPPRARSGSATSSWRSRPAAAPGGALSTSICGIGAVVLDAEADVAEPERELRLRRLAAVDELMARPDADDAAPGARADQRADAPSA